jgi:hypothetical protein
MIRLYISNEQLNEDIQIARIDNDRYNQKRLIFVSDVDDKDEIFFVKDVLKKFGAAWDNQDKVWYFSTFKKPQEEVFRRAVDARNAANTFLKEKGKDKPEVSDDVKIKREKLINSFEEVEEFIAKSNFDSVTKEELSRKLEEFVNDLANEVDEPTLMAKIQEYLNFASRFHQYSFYNRILIYIQRPDAERVASVNTWKKFGRTLKDTAKSIWIWVPIMKEPSKQEKEQILEKFYKDLNIPKGQKLTDEQKTELSKRFDAVSTLVGWKEGRVFDISDTIKTDDGAEDIVQMPQWDDDNTPDEMADKVSEGIIQVAKDLGINVKIVKGLGGAKGVSMGGNIEILDNISGISKASVLVHELAHELMHQQYLKNKPTIDNASVVDDDNSDIVNAYVGRNPKEVNELQAEATTYVVLRNYGIKNKYNSVYLALWKAKGPQIKANLNIITNTASVIIKRLDKYLGSKNINEFMEPWLTNESIDEFDINEINLNIMEQKSIIKNIINEG